MGVPVASGTLAGSRSGSWGSIHEEPRQQRALSLPSTTYAPTTRTTRPTVSESDVASRTASLTARRREEDRRHRCCEIRPIASLAELVERICFGSLWRLLAAASSRVEQAQAHGGLGDGGPTPPRAAASEADSRPHRASPCGWKRCANRDGLVLRGSLRASAVRLSGRPLAGGCSRPASSRRTELATSGCGRDRG
jgi:hypothetical protein